MSLPLLAVWFIPAGGQVTEYRTHIEFPDSVKESFLDATMLVQPRR